MHPHDEDTAVIFRALADPMSRQLIRHLLHAGECDSAVGRELQLDRRASALRLERLTAAGLIVQAQSGDGTQLYRLSDAAGIERLLALVHQLRTKE